MTTPYEPVLRHEIPPNARACKPCVFQSINTPCADMVCQCICNVDTVATYYGDPPADTPTPGWVGPPAGPEPLATWTSRQPLRTGPGNLTKNGESEEHTVSTTGDNLWIRLLRWLKGGPHA